MGTSELIVLPGCIVEDDVQHNLIIYWNADSLQQSSRKMTPKLSVINRTRNQRILMSKLRWRVVRVILVEGTTVGNPMNRDAADCRPQIIVTMINRKTEI
jgi:hypothetical protein